MDGGIIGSIIALGGLAVAAGTLWITSKRDNKNEKRASDAATLAAMATLVEKAATLGAEGRAAQLHEREQCTLELANLRADHVIEIDMLIKAHKRELAEARKVKKA